MAACNYCNQEMNDIVGCTLTEYDDGPGGVTKARIPYPDFETRPCHDCKAPPGALHHPGCDDEVCPYCEGQAISCNCTDLDEIGGR